MNTNLNSVRVLFTNPAYNYTTSVSPQSTEESCKEYFVGQWFNVGVYPNENLQKCIGMEFNADLPENALCYQLLKIEGCDPVLLWETLSKFPADAWFCPSNKGGNDYSVLSELYEYNLVECKRTPLWKDGVLRGCTIAFRYNVDLNYKPELKAVTI